MSQPSEDLNMDSTLPQLPTVSEPEEEKERSVKKRKIEETSEEEKKESDHGIGFIHIIMDDLSLQTWELNLPTTMTLKFSSRLKAVTCSKQIRVQLDEAGKSNRIVKRNDHELILSLVPITKEMSSEEKDAIVNGNDLIRIFLDWDAEVDVVSETKPMEVSASDVTMVNTLTESEEEKANRESCEAEKPLMKTLTNKKPIAIDHLEIDQDTRYKWHDMIKYIMEGVWCPSINKIGDKDTIMSDAVDSWKNRFRLMYKTFCSMAAVPMLSISVLKEWRHNCAAFCIFIGVHLESEGELTVRPLVKIHLESLQKSIEWHLKYYEENKVPIDADRSILVRVPYIKIVQWDKFMNEASKDIDNIFVTEDSRNNEDWNPLKKKMKQLFGTVKRSLFHELLQLPISDGWSSVNRTLIEGIGNVAVANLLDLIETAIEIEDTPKLLNMQTLCTIMQKEIQFFTNATAVDINTHNNHEVNKDTLQEILRYLCDAINGFATVQSKVNDSQKKEWIMQELKSAKLSILTYLNTDCIAYPIRIARGHSFWGDFPEIRNLQYISKEFSEEQTLELESAKVLEKIAKELEGKLRAVMY